MSTPDFDVIIIGAGISGIGMAAHMRRECPNHSFAVLERRSALGGTWDLFRYPGVRSDSDMYTLGYDFEPWRDDQSIAAGETILAYLNRVADDYGVRPHIRFDTQVTAAHWSSADALWTVQTAAGEAMTARYLYLGAGYYDQDAGHNPDFPGKADFTGRIIHPQFWPQDLDYTGKRVVIIGSGATAVTLVPAMAEQAARVTMLQRTPTYHIIRPSRDRLANALRRVLPARWAYATTRAINVRVQRLLFNRSRARPDKVKAYLIGQVRRALGGRMNEADWTPPYNPWEQRLCLVPDNDFFDAIAGGKAEVVTDHIARFDAGGITLSSGRHLDADIIVTATGLTIVLAGKIALSIDGVPVQLNEHLFYKGAMLSNIPNLSLVFGYLNASWTLKADIVARFTCRVLNHMRTSGADTVTPRINPASAEADDALFDFTSGYVQRALAQLPRNGKADPWRINQDYLHDRRLLMHAPLEDGVLHFALSAAATETSNPQGHALDSIA